MATYAELRNLLNDSALLNKVTVAVGVAAETIQNESGATANHANRLLWAKDAYSNPTGISRQVFWAVIIANRASTVVQIQAASDTAIQTNVDAVIDIFATG